MGILNKLAQRRRQARTEIRAAQARARQEVKENSRKQQRREKLLRGLEKDLLKAEHKGLKNARKHEQKLAKQELEKIKEGRINPKRVGRWIAAARVASPVVLPLLYRAVTASREKFASSNPAGNQRGRIDGLRRTLENADVPTGYRDDAIARLNELSTAVDNAEFMSSDQRSRALAAINRDIDKLAQDINSRL